MGQKINPTGYRMGIMEDWRSRWYAGKAEFKDLLVEDFKVRKYIKKRYSYAGIPKIEIERTRDAVVVLLHTARPGVIIGRKGAEALAEAGLPAGQRSKTVSPPWTACRHRTLEGTQE